MSATQYQNGLKAGMIAAIADKSAKAPIDSTVRAYFHAPSASKWGMYEIGFANGYIGEYCPSMSAPSAPDYAQRPIQENKPMNAQTMPQTYSQRFAMPSAEAPQTYPICAIGELFPMPQFDDATFTMPIVCPAPSMSAPILPSNPTEYAQQYKRWVNSYNGRVQCDYAPLSAPLCDAQKITLDAPARDYRSAVWDCMSDALYAAHSDRRWGYAPKDEIDQFSRLPMKYGALGLQNIFWRSWDAAEAKAPLTSFAKRANSIAQKLWRLPMNDTYAQRLGNIESAHAAHKITFDVTSILDWGAGDFGDEQSCFHSYNAHHRIVFLPEMGAMALRSYGAGGAGSGRAFLVPFGGAAPAYVFTNQYGALGNKFDDDHSLGQWAMIQILNAHSGFDWELRTDIAIDLADTYTNSDAIVIAPIGHQFTSRWVNIERTQTLPDWAVKLSANCHFAKCDQCGEFAGDLIRVHGGDEICEGCLQNGDWIEIDGEYMTQDDYDENYCHCEMCETDIHLDYSMSAINGNGDDITVCESCYERHCTRTYDDAVYVTSKPRYGGAWVWECDAEAIAECPITCETFHIADEGIKILIAGARWVWVCKNACEYHNLIEMGALGWTLKHGIAYAIYDETIAPCNAFPIMIYNQS